MFQSSFVFLNIILFALLIALQETIATRDGNVHCPIIKDKHQWGGIPSMIINYRPLPTKNVILYYQTLTPKCTTFLTCANIVQIIQYVHLIIYGLDDIGYNFLISNDGLVYEGAGWYIEGGHNINSTSIAFIGKTIGALPSIEALDAAKQLLNCGVENGFLDPNYDLYGGTQLILPHMTKLLPLSNNF